MPKHILFSSIQIGKLELKNRIVMAPMCTQEVREKDGIITDFHKVHYGARALGGVGLINIEATAVEPNGRISVYDLGLWNEHQAEKLKELVGLLHGFGAKVAIQLAHAGRKAVGVEKVIAPSAVAFPGYEMPTEMSTEDIKEVVECFRRSASYAAGAGVDVIEIHAAHGYLINQFLSPLSNHRKDLYGGNLINRYLLLKEVITVIKEVFSGSLWVRISADEYEETGNQREDFIQIATWLREEGIDVVDISSGGVTEKYPDHIYAGYQVPLAAGIKAGAKIPVAAVGLLNDPKLAEYVLQSEQADLICLGRPLLSNPNWLQMAADVLGEKGDFVAYNRAYERGRTI